MPLIDCVYTWVPVVMLARNDLAQVPASAPCKLKLLANGCQSARGEPNRHENPALMILDNQVFV